MLDKETEEIIKALDTDILAKIDTIQERILTGAGPNEPLLKIEMLAMINDELSDVLLNWDVRIIDSGLGGMK